MGSALVRVESYKNMGAIIGTRSARERISAKKNMERLNNHDASDLLNAEQLVSGTCGIINWRSISSTLLFCLGFFCRVVIADTKKFNFPGSTLLFSCQRKLSEHQNKNKTKHKVILVFSFKNHLKFFWMIIIPNNSH